MNRSVWIGFDRREVDAFAVARHSIVRRLTQPIPVRGVHLPDLRAKGLYSRRMSTRDGRLWDDISNAPCATEFSLTRFLTPHLAGNGWALFVDCDVMARTNVARLFDLADPKYAVMCVKHEHKAVEGLKMDGQVQTAYQRKNWSSVMLFNVAHPANRALTLDYINTAKGLDLHQFAWLDDDLIGALPKEWNHLVGVDAPNPDAKIAHMTLGIPTMPGYEACEFAEEWRNELRRWAE